MCILHIYKKMWIAHANCPNARFVVGRYLMNSAMFGGSRNIEISNANVTLAVGEVDSGLGVQCFGARSKTRRRTQPDARRPAPAIDRSQCGLYYLLPKYGGVAGRRPLRWSAGKPAYEHPCSFSNCSVLERPRPTLPAFSSPHAAVCTELPTEPRGASVRAACPTHNKLHVPPSSFPV